METWFIIIITLCILALIKSTINLLSSSTTTTTTTTKLKAKLPPGPPTIPIIGNFIWLRKSFSELEPLLRNLHSKYGPMVTLHIGSRPAVFIADRSLTHRALIQTGAVFSDRPPALEANKILSSNQHNISSAAYGPTWRLLRRNLTTEILHPSRVKSYSSARKWVLDILLNRLKSQSETNSAIPVVADFQYAMFCLLVFMCFGDKIGEKQIKYVERVQRDLLLNINRFNILSFMPTLGKILFRKRWEELYKLKKNKDDVLIPLITARREMKGNGSMFSYVDSLLNLELPEENKRKLDEGELVSLCSEFLDAGTDTTSTALQWIMANVVKYSRIQDKLVEEIKGVVGDKKDVVEEDDLQKMSYLKAVVLEGLRRHPPGHFVLPHSVTEDVSLDGLLVPKHGTVNFMVAEMGWDPKVWEEPMEFKPERFLNGGGEVFDITSNREIKMMPFGAGRRICPANALALLHLEYFLANLVWRFQWAAEDGHEVDLTEKQDFTVVMKNPLMVHLSPRFK